MKNLLILTISIICLMSCGKADDSQPDYQPVNLYADKHVDAYIKIWDVAGSSYNGEIEVEGVRSKSILKYSKENGFYVFEPDMPDMREMDKKTDDNGNIHKYGSTEAMLSADGCQILLSFKFDYTGGQEGSWGTPVISLSEITYNGQAIGNRENGNCAELLISGKTILPITQN